MKNSKTFNRSLLCLVILLFLTGAALADGPADGSADASTGMPTEGDHAWWFWPIVLFVSTFIMGIIAVLGGVGGGELFVPKIPSMRMLDLAEVIAPEAKIEIIGIRPGEKLHEVMVPEDDARNAVELKDRYVIMPPEKWKRHDSLRIAGKACPSGFSYASDNNSLWLSSKDLTRMIAGLDQTDAKEWTKERDH